MAVCELITLMESAKNSNFVARSAFLGDLWYNRLVFLEDLMDGFCLRDEIWV